MWGSTSAERNENFIKWSRGWFCCFIHKNSSEIPSKNPINKTDTVFERLQQRIAETPSEWSLDYVEHHQMMEKVA